MRGSGLGVGILFNPALPDWMRTHADEFDYLEIIPDREWADHGVGASPRHSVLEKSLQFFREVRARKPLVCHSIGLSIGSAALFDDGHVAQIGRLHDMLDFAWHSDHLAFSRLAAPGGELHTAIALPVPYDHEVLDLIAERVRRVRAQVACDFLLENNVHYVRTPEQELSEPQFLNRLAADSGCGILLDLHNVYVNARNYGFSAEAFVDEMDLSNVREIHVAGGDDFMGVYTDSHAGPVPEPVWALLERTLRAATAVRGVTFEFHESSYPLLRGEGISAQLRRARAIWDRCAA